MRNDPYPYKNPSGSVKTIQAQGFAGSDLSRVLPRQNSIGSSRGQQTVGYGLTKIDGSNNTITVGSEGGTQVQGIGTVPSTSNSTGAQYGFFQTDSAGKIIWKLVEGTSYRYNNKDNYNNAILDGFAPDDGRPGIWVAKTGFDAYNMLKGS